MSARPDNPAADDLLTALAHSAVRLADRAVICDIESEGDCKADGVWDITALFNEREHSPEHIDMAMESMGYALSRGLIEIISSAPLQVRILRRPDSLPTPSHTPQ